MCNPFQNFNGSPEVIRLTVMMYTRYPLSLRQVEDLLFEWASTSTTSLDRTVLPSWPSSVSLQPEHLRPAPFAAPSTFV